MHRASGTAIFFAFPPPGIDSTVRRKLVKTIYDLAWPVLIARLAVMAYSVIDTMMAGRYATDDLAAVGVGASIYFSVFVALMGVLLAVTPTVAQLQGAGLHGEIGEQVRQAMWLAVALAVVSVVVYSHPDPLLEMSEAPPTVAAKVRAYLAIAAWGAPAGLAFRLFASAVPRERRRVVGRRPRRRLRDRTHRRAPAVRARSRHTARRARLLDRRDRRHGRRRIGCRHLLLSCERAGQRARGGRRGGCAMEAHAVPSGCSGARAPHTR